MKAPVGSRSFGKWDKEGRRRNSGRMAGNKASEAREKRASAAMDGGRGSKPDCRNLTTGKLVPKTAATKSASARGHSTLLSDGSGEDVGVGVVGVVSVVRVGGMTSVGREASEVVDVGVDVDVDAGVGGVLGAEKRTIGVGEVVDALSGAGDGERGGKRAATGVIRWTGARCRCNASSELERGRRLMSGAAWTNVSVAVMVDSWAL